MNTLAILATVFAFAGQFGDAWTTERGFARAYPREVNPVGRWLARATGSKLWPYIGKLPFIAIMVVLWVFVQRDVAICGAVLGTIGLGATVNNLVWLNSQTRRK